MLGLQKMLQSGVGQAGGSGGASCRKAIDSVFDEIADEQGSTSDNSVPEPSQRHTLVRPQLFGKTTCYRTGGYHLGPDVSEIPLSTKRECGSKRLFSPVLHIVNENGNRLTADNAQKLLFIKKNLSLTFPKQAWDDIRIISVLFPQLWTGKAATHVTGYMLGNYVASPFYSPFYTETA